MAVLSPVPCGPPGRPLPEPPLSVAVRDGTGLAKNQGECRASGLVPGDTCLIRHLAGRHANFNGKKYTTTSSIPSARHWCIALSGTPPGHPIGPCYQSAKKGRQKSVHSILLLVNFLGFRPVFNPDRFARRSSLRPLSYRQSCIRRLICVYEL